MAKRIAAVVLCLSLLAAAGCNKYLTRKKQEAHQAKMAEAIMLLARMEAELLEGVEEAMAYCLMEEEEEKEDHLLMMSEFDGHVDMFNEMVDLDLPEHEGLKEPFTEMLDAKDEMAEAALELFASVEARGKVSPSDVRAFEHEVDNVTELYDSFMERFLEKHYKEHLIKEKDTVAAVRLARMQSDLLEAVEELFGHFLLNDAVERQEFFAKLADFDAQAAAFEELEYIGEPGSEEITAPYGRVMSSKKDFEIAALKLLTDFGTTRTLKEERVETLERAIDRLTGDYDALLKEFEFLRMTYEGRR